VRDTTEMQACYWSAVFAICHCQPIRTRRHLQQRAVILTCREAEYLTVSQHVWRLQLARHTAGALVATATNRSHCLAVPLGQLSGLTVYQCH